MLCCVSATPKPKFRVFSDPDRFSEFIASRGNVGVCSEPGSVTKSRRKSISGASERHRDGASFVLIGDVDENLGVSSTFSASCDRFANFCTGFRPSSLFFLSASVRHDCINLNVWAVFIFIFSPYRNGESDFRSRNSSDFPFRSANFLQFPFCIQFSGTKTTTKPFCIDFNGTHTSKAKCDMC